MARSEDNPRSSRDKEDEEPKGRAQRAEAHDPMAEFEAKIKAWMRTEIALASSGVTEEERAERNP